MYSLELYMLQERDFYLDFTREQQQYCSEIPRICQLQSALDKDNIMFMNSFSTMDSECSEYRFLQNSN
jgi:hypothetical protein